MGCRPVARAMVHPDPSGCRPPTGRRGRASWRSVDEGVDINDEVSLGKRIDAHFAGRCQLGQHRVRNDLTRSVVHASADTSTTVQQNLTFSRELDSKSRLLRRSRAVPMTERPETPKRTRRSRGETSHRRAESCWRSPHQAQGARPRYSNAFPSPASSRLGCARRQGPMTRWPWLPPPRGGSPRTSSVRPTPHLLVVKLTRFC